MKERPIIMQAESVRAILDGSKTQTALACLCLSSYTSGNDGGRPCHMQIQKSAKHTNGEGTGNGAKSSSDLPESDTTVIESASASGGWNWPTIIASKTMIAKESATPNGGLRRSPRMGRAVFVAGKPNHYFLSSTTSTTMEPNTGSSSAPVQRRSSNG